MLNASQIATVKAAALQLLPPPRMRREQLNAEAVNSDIVRWVPQAARLHVRDCERLAPAMFRRRTPRASMEDAWSYLRFGIRYKVDSTNAEGVLKQDTASPGATERRGIADCKSLTIYLHSILYCLGIPCIIRFASYGTPGIFTHVYCVAWDGSGWLPVDPVWDWFGQEKPYTEKRDFKMDLGHISGVGDNGPRPGGKAAYTSTGKKVVMVPRHTDTSLGAEFDPAKATDGEMKLVLYRQRMAIKKQLAQGAFGVGSVIDERYSDHLDVVTDLLASYRAGDMERIDTVLADAERGEYDQARSMAGIGNASGRQQKREEKRNDRQRRQAERKAEPKKPVVKKVAEAIKKAAGAAVKVATAVPRLAMKALLEVTLPKAAPAFLYLFVNDEKVVKQLPNDVRVKREKARKMHAFYVESLGMKDEHLLGIYRNGILKKYGKEPEALIREALTKPGTSGVGLIDDVIEVVREIVAWISKNVGKKAAPGFGKEDLPDLGKDFKGAQAPGTPGAVALAKQVLDQSDDLDKLEETNSGDPGRVSNGRVKSGPCGR